MRILDWKEVSKAAKNYTDLILELADEKFSYLGPRQEIVQEKYNYYKNCLDSVFQILEDCIIYCNNFPQLDDLAVANLDEYQKWAKFENDNDIFVGIWEFFGYRIPLFIDDAGQQYFTIFRDSETGELEDICGGSFNTASEDIGSQVLEHIHKETIYKFKYKVNEKFIEYNVKVE